VRKQLAPTTRSLRGFSMPLGERLADGMPPITVEELAAEIGCSVSFIYERIRSGGIRVERRREREYRIGVAAARKLAIETGALDEA
jgi:excisionase family DNA binding protein